LLNKICGMLVSEKISHGREAAGRQPGHNRARRTSDGFSFIGHGAHIDRPEAPRSSPPAAGLVARRKGDGALKPWARHFYKSKAWGKVREAYIAYRHRLCERCGAGGKIVHHKIYLTPDNINDPEITLSFDNLELLCQECHNLEHHERAPVAEGLRFTADGDLISVDGGDAHAT